MSDKELTIEYVPIFPLTLQRVSLANALPFEEMAAALVEKAKTPTPEYNGGWTSYFNNTQIDDIPGFKDLVGHIMGMGEAIANEYRWKCLHANTKLQIWANVMQPGGYHEPHAHARSHISGTFYVQRNESSAPIVFENPLEGYKMHEPILFDTSPLSDPLIAFNPQPGDLLMWPSYLRHLVPKISTAEVDPRISISFNLDFEVNNG